MRFSYAESMVDPTFYLPLAKAAEEAGYDSMVVPDSLCYPEVSDSTYPFNPDGSREFLDGKPFLEPFSLIPAMGAVTERIRFVTFVLKLPMRHPLIVAKQATSVAVLTGNRLSLGVGASPWPEDYELVDVPWEGRGRRMDEAVEVVRGLSAGGYFEFHGECYDIQSVKICPVPSEPLPILIGGHATPALRRAARCDGWLHGGGDPADLPGLLDQAPPAPRGGGHRRQALRGPRHLGRRLHGRRHPPARGAGGHRRDRRLPVALRGGPGHRAPAGEARQPAPVRRHGHDPGGAVTAPGASGPVGPTRHPDRPGPRAAIHGRRRGGRPRRLARPVQRRRRRRGPGRAVDVRPRGDGTPGTGGHRRLLRQRDRGQRVDPLHHPAVLRLRRRGGQRRDHPDQFRRRRCGRGRRRLLLPAWRPTAGWAASGPSGRPTRSAASSSDAGPEGPDRRSGRRTVDVRP